MTDKPTPEQRARDMLERMDIPDAQSLSAGELVEIANLIAEVDELRLKLDNSDGYHGAVESSADT